MCCLLQCLHYKTNRANSSQVYIVTNRTVGALAQYVRMYARTSRMSPLSKGSPASRDGMRRSCSGLYMKCAFMYTWVPKKAASTTLGSTVMTMEPEDPFCDTKRRGGWCRRSRARGGGREGGRRRGRENREGGREGERKEEREGEEGRREGGNCAKSLQIPPHSQSRHLQRCYEHCLTQVHKDPLSDLRTAELFTTPYKSLPQRTKSMR